MALSRLLEDFGDNPETGTEVAMTDVMVESQKLEAFEKGYQAGWDDSVKAQHESATRIAEDFAGNIRDLSFTYQEAYAGFIAAMEPLIRQIVDVVLPKLAIDTLGPRVAELLQQEVATHGRQTVHIITAPGSAGALRAILPDDEVLQIEIEEDETLAEGQVHLRLGTATEREIDLQEVLAGIGTAVEGFFQEASQTLKEIA